MQCVCCGVWKEKTPEFFKLSRGDNVETTPPDKNSFRNSASHGCHKCHRKPASKVRPSNIPKEDKKFIDHLIKPYPQLNHTWAQKFKRDGNYLGHYTKIKLPIVQGANFEMVLFRKDTLLPFTRNNCVLDIIELTKTVTENGETICQINSATEWEGVLGELATALRWPYLGSMSRSRANIHEDYAPSPPWVQQMIPYDVDSVRDKPWVIELMRGQVLHCLDVDVANGYMPQNYLKYDGYDRLVYVATHQLVDVQRMLCHVSRLPLSRIFLSREMFALTPDRNRYFDDNDGDPQLCSNTAFVRRLFKPDVKIAQKWTRKKLLQSFVQHPLAPADAVQIAQDELKTLIQK